MTSLPSAADLNLFPVLPAIIVATGMCLLLLIDLWIPEDKKNRTAWLAQGILVTAFIVNLFTFNITDTAVLGMYVADRATAFLNMVTLFTTFICIFLAMDYLKRIGAERGEFYSLILFSASGAMFMASANDLIVIFVALELLSIPLYVMAAFRYRYVPGEELTQTEINSEEAGMKYFILGAFASAFYVYGAALVYGGTGSTNLSVIFQSVALIGGDITSGSLTLLVLGAGLILVGLGFKIAVFPFHMWTPDVYEGSPTNVTAFMSVAAKIGGVAALARILVSGLPALAAGTGENAAWQLAVSSVAILTMVLGNFVAIQQSNMKRMLAYSSIAHGGYLLMAIAAAGTIGNSASTMTAISVYLLTYMFTNLGAFAVVIAIEKPDGTGTDIEDLAGLSRSQPFLAGLMTLFMLSLVGIPATAGFIGKYFVFAAAVQAELYLLAIVGILTSVASAYYYMRPVIAMYLADEDAQGDPAEGATQYVRWAIYLSGAGVLLLGLIPGLATGLIEGLVMVASTGF
ncbi:MAG: NADH-quinone oxidoreductase subunit N [Chloroflexota bacterium]